MQPSPAFTDIWSAAAEMLAWLRGLFGSPYAFLSRRELTQRRAALAYLRPLERVLRCCIFYLALTMPGPVKPPACARGGARRAWLRRPCWPGEDSAQWRGVRFPLWPAPAQPRRRMRARAHAPAATVFSPLPIARRMEAVARVMAAPERWIWRTARRLRAAPALGARIAPLLTPSSVGEAHPLERFIAAARALLGAALAPDTS